MKNYVIEFDKDYRGYRIIGLFLVSGHRTGYVVMNEDQELKDFNYEELYVHGGITFQNNHLQDLIDDKYVIGFDCAHYNDGFDREAFQKHFKEHPEFEFRLDMETKYSHKENYVVKNKEFVEAELKELVDQLITIKRIEVIT